jgi:hypothetical protein
VADESKKPSITISTEANRPPEKPVPFGTFDGGSEAMSKLTASAASGRAAYDMAHAAKRSGGISRAPPPPRPSLPNAHYHPEPSKAEWPSAPSPSAEDRTSPEVMETPRSRPPKPIERGDAPSGQPMHARDRRLYVILAWTAIPAALVVGCFIAWGGGQLPGRWAIAGMSAGIVGMAIGTVYALEKRAPFPRSPGPIIVGLAVLTWVLVGWQAWLSFHSQPPAAPQAVATLCSDGPCAPVHLKPGAQYVKEIGLGPGAGPEPLFLQATSTVTTDRLRVVVDYSEYRSGWMPKTRAFIGEIREPVKGKTERLQLIYSAVRPNGGTNNLWWGDPAQDHAVSASTFNGSPLPAIIVRARVAIIGPGGEQHYYFILIRDAENHGTQVGIIPEHDSGDWIESWEAD